jgi:ankyrin repeat protein
VDGQGFTALEAASCGSSTLVVESLLKYGARFPVQKEAPSVSSNVLTQITTENPTASSEMLDSALHLAAFWNRSEIINLLLRKGADPNVYGYMGKANMHYATVMGNLEAINTLIAGKADVDSMSYQRVDWGLLKQTPLRLAIEFEKIDAMEALIKAGAETQKPNYDIYHPIDRNGIETIFHRDPTQKFSSVTVIGRLSSNGASPNAPDEKLQNLLHILS